MYLHAAELAIREASWRFDNDDACGEAASTAKYLAAEAAFFAADPGDADAWRLQVRPRVPRRTVLARGTPHEDRSRQPGDDLQLHQRRCSACRSRIDRVVSIVLKGVAMRATCAPRCPALPDDHRHADRGDLGREIGASTSRISRTTSSLRSVRRGCTHLVVFFRDQVLDSDRFLAAARRVGTPVDAFVPGIDGYPRSSP